MAELLLLYRLTRTTGIRMSELTQMDAWEVEVMIAIETARYNYYVNRIKQVKTGSAEVATVHLLELLLESELLI